MTSRLEQELRLSRPIASLEAEALLNIRRTSYVLSQDCNELLKQEDLSQAQFNALRILRGAGECGCACRSVGERMLARVPDVTRLLDRLEKRGLVERARDCADRRIVTVRISDAGRELLARLDEPMSTTVCNQLNHLSQDQLRQLIDLLEAARAPNAASGDATV